ncbi:hypothetical protein Cni_G03057 [Canna indica]|uniref:Small ribosomal subunit protein uS15c n=1 Tax=Canna indica TaxID=4628 RepID=A0AAQ3JTT2_9LILI|nr:hypothetical protein Cni_G03057 [Canna indica]
MALHLKLRPKTLIPLRSVRPFFSSSSATPPPQPDPQAESDTSASDAGGSPSPPSYSSYFSDVKKRLKAPPSPPRRIPSDPPPPPPLSSPKTSPTSLEDIRKHLAGFRLGSRGPAAPPGAGDGPASSPPISFQELYKSNVLGKAGGEGVTEKGEARSFDSIRQSLLHFRASSREKTGGRWGDGLPGGSLSLKPFRDSIRNQLGEMDKSSSIFGGDLPKSIFGKELREKEAGEGGSKKVLKTEFVKTYDYGELGEKLRGLRPEDAAKGDKDWFSLTELNERLAKLREVEDKEIKSRMGGVLVSDLRESLMRLKETDANKKTDMKRLSIIGSLTGPATPTYMLKPPQEQLLERYFHPDHMSSAEKMKLELKRVRDEFKMSESDCGSARVQVAQLTTKIKHLNTVLHKKDKHSRKGLLDMVQRRKKLLKYLRRTDWDSYCLVLSKLGLRDVPEYKKPKYKA